MKHKTPIEERIRGWLTKETSLPSNQTISMFSHLTRFHLVQLAYGIMLITLLIVPFGVYHSRSEPYITGYLLAKKEEGNAGDISTRWRVQFNPQPNLPESGSPPPTSKQRSR